jgi:DNA-binding transcriptional MerR regulator
MNRFDQSRGIMLISQLAKAAGVSVETIRYYQRIGLLAVPTARSSLQRRVYGSEDLKRLLFIRNARGFGFKLKEIKQLMDANDLNRVCTCMKQTLDRKFIELVHLINELTARCDHMRGLMKICETCEQQFCSVYDSFLPDRDQSFGSK